MASSLDEVILLNAHEESPLWDLWDETRDICSFEELRDRLISLLKTGAVELYQSVEGKNSPEFELEKAIEIIQDSGEWNPKILEKKNREIYLCSGSLKR